MQPRKPQYPLPVLPREAWNVWLDPDVETDGLAELLRPYADDDLVADPVSTQVNNVRNDSPECVEPKEK